MPSHGVMPGGEKDHPEALLVGIRLKDVLEIGVDRFRTIETGLGDFEEGWDEFETGFIDTHGFDSERGGAVYPGIGY